jgi:hypothetical protein
MITCSVCGQRNDDLAVLCVSCRSYLQSKVDNLNLFETVWQLIENPGAAFKKIVLARHKNYVFVLSSLLGVSSTFALFWLINLGNRFENLLILTGAGGLLGIPLGIAFVLVVGFVVSNAISLLGGRASQKDSRAVVAYAGMPIVLSLVAIFPLEVAIFGIDFFGTNPPPLVINPFAYMGLLGFDALATLWSVLLLYKGVTVLSGFRKIKALAATVIAALFPTALLLGMKVLRVV